MYCKGGWGFREALTAWWRGTRSAALVWATIQRRARRYAEATGEELPIPGKRTSMRPTARMILGSFDPIIVVIMPDSTRTLAESRLFPHKMFKALGVSPLVYLCPLQESAGP